eukprot:9412579-Lingulodinium_polyedra.AAC.1
MDGSAANHDAGARPAEVPSRARGRGCQLCTGSAQPLHGCSHRPGQGGCTTAMTSVPPASWAPALDSPMR